jgi:hypothetical protein
MPSNPIKELIDKREAMQYPEWEKKLKSRMDDFARELRTGVIESFSIQLLTRYEGGLTQEQRFEVIRDFKKARVARLLKEEFFNHITLRNGERSIVYGLEGDLLEIFRNTIYSVYEKEQQAITKTVNRGSSLKASAKLTGKDRQRLRKLVIGGMSLQQYVKAILAESYGRLVARMKQAIIVEYSTQAMIVRMKRDTGLVIEKLANRLSDYQFEVISYAANVAQNDFLKALRVAA